MRTPLRTLTSLIAIFALCFVAAAMPAPAVLQTRGGAATIGGVIRDAGGAAIAGVKVTAGPTGGAANTTATTDAKGAYTFSNLAPGTYRVTAESGGLQTSRYSSVAVTSGQNLTLNFRMQAGAVTAPVELVLGAVDVVATNGTLSGVVTDASSRPLAGAYVTAVNAVSGASASRLTDDRGAYAFQNLTPGTYSVTAEQSGFVTGRKTNVALADKQTVRSDFSLQGQVAAAGQGQAGNIGRGQGAGVGPAAPPPPPPPPMTAPPPVTVTPAPAAGAAAGIRGAAGRGGAPGGGGGARGGGGGGSVVGATSSGSLSTPSSVFVARDRATNTSPQFNNEEYNRITDNPFMPISVESLATFSIDVDTASYSNVRRFLTQNQRPPRDAVRIEELINYFPYDYPQASGSDPITGNLEVAAAPWNPSHRLVRVGIKAKDVPRGLKSSNLVFLIDVSGSMSTPERLPLLKSGLRLLVDRLTENDKVTIVTYAGDSGLALPPTSGDRKDEILRAIDKLTAEGSTNGSAGIQLAYDQAMATFIKGGVNRVILATDGDFNVGITNQNDLVRLVEDKAGSGVFLSTLGFGTGNYKDGLIEQLADKGNGNYAYIDSLNEARKVLVDQMAGTFVTVAKDVKIQVEFNPAQVEAYRLIGYENRALRAEDFNNDRKDAGEMGSGQSVTAFFEVVPHGVAIEPPPVDFLGKPDNVPAIDPLRYPAIKERSKSSELSNELLDLKIRYKEPDSDKSKLLEVPLVDRGGAFTSATNEFRFAAAVAGFGLILRDSPYKGSANWEMIRSIAASSMGMDRNGYRDEFIRLVERATQTWRR